tara:strand:- start:83 stop:709 length:627 start_codon:yes stop_codon:yes gene_type:complete
MSVGFIIIILNFLFSFKGFRDRKFFDKWLLNSSKILKGQWYRNITSGFLHINQGHLFLNMLTFYFFYGSIETKLGQTSLLFIYMISLISGNILAFKLNKFNLNYNAVGASGAVLGIIYSSILLNPYMTIFLFIIPMPAFLFGIGYLIYSMYSMKSNKSNIGHEAHIGGAIGGFFTTIILYPSILLNNIFVVILLLVPIIYFYLRISKK